MDEPRARVAPPAFASLTDEYAAAFNHHVRRLARRDGVLASISRHAIHEGRSSTLTRSDGTTVDLNLQEMGDEFNLTFDEIHDLDLNRVIEKLVLLAESLRRQQSEMVFRHMDEATKSTGQVIDGRGKPMDFDGVIAALEMLPPSYDPVTGESTISMVVAPAMMKRIAQLEAEFKTNKEQQKLVAELEQRKKDEFRREEMARSLVG